MDQIMRLHTTIRFIESHITEEIDYRALGRAVGLSYRQLREDFSARTGRSLKRYINSRRIAYAAFEIETTSRTLLEIATRYGFASYDTFTRAFKRETGMTPSACRREGHRLARRQLIGMGTYAPALIQRPPGTAPPPSPGDCILYGVPRVAFSTGKCTPLPACVESLLTYIGQREHCSYMWLAAASGIAFRLCWNGGAWDMGNSNALHLSAGTPWDICRRTFAVSGWDCGIRTREDGKAAWKAAIRAGVAKGVPAVALGVIGPPEACVITGCLDGGETLLGWSFFQEHPEFAADMRTDASGCFLSDRWWENPATTALITLGRRTAPPAPGEVLRNIHATLTLQSAGVYLAGQRAYGSWAADLTDDAAFREDSITPVLLDRFFCQADAETMVGEGRYWGALFFQQLGQAHPALAPLCDRAAALLRETAAYAGQMTAVRHGAEPTEEAVRLFCRPDTRGRLAALVRRARDSEKAATAVIEKILERL